MKRRLLSAFLAVMMVLTMAPVAFAADDAENTVGDTGSSESAPAKTLQQQIDGIKGTGTVTLDKDYTEYVNIPKDSNITLDLNGHKISSGTTTILNNGTLIVRDSSEKKNGVIESMGNVGICVGSNSVTTVEYANIQAKEGAVITSYATDATITIKDGVFTALDNAVVAGNGSPRDGNANVITINGGTFTGNIKSAGYIACGIYAPWKDIITVNGGNFTVNNGIGIVARAGQVTVNGGTFTCTGSAKGGVGDKKFDMDAAQCVYFDASNPAYPAYNSETDYIKLQGGKFSSDVSAYVAKGYVQNENGTVEQLGETNAVAKVGDTYYKTLAEAVAAAKDGDTVTLLKNVVLNSTLTLNKNMTLDLNGCEISNGSTMGTNYLVSIAANANVSIVGDKANSKISDSRSNAQGTITAVVVYGKLTVEGDNLTISRGANGIAVKVEDNPGTLTVNGGTITVDKPTQTSSQAIQNWGNATISGGVFNGDVDSYAYIAANKNYVGNMTIENGTFDGEVFAAQYTNDGVTWPTKSAKVSIVGGNFKGNIAEYYHNGNNGPQPVEKVNKPDNAAESEVTVSDGYFTVDPSAYCVTGKTGVTSDKDGYQYKVGTIEVKDENEIKTDTQKGATQATLGDKIAAGDKTAATAVGTSVTPTKLTDTTPITADDKAQALTELVKKNKVKLTDDGKIPAGTTVTVVKETYLDVTVTAYDTKSNTVSMDITPKYNLIATTDKDNRTDANSVTLETKPLTVSEATKVSVTIPAFANKKVYIDHANGKNLYVATADENGKIEFTTNGFSPFTFTLSNPNVVAEVNGNAYTSFQDAVNAVANGGTIEIVGGNKNYTATISGSSKTFTVKNTLDSDITVKVNNDSKTVGKNNGTQSFTYTKPSSGGSSGGSSSGKTTYKVTTSAVNNGGVNASPSSAEKGATITITLSPDKGYKLDKLTVTDGSGKTVSTVKKSDTVYTFTMPASAVKVGVSYVKATETPSETKFNDVSANDWFASAVDYVTGKGMMNGTADNTFSPKANTTRGMVVTVLYRLENQPSTSAASFTDVASGAYYANAVAWANANGIVSGYGSGKFGPNDKVTREQLAAILYRYAQYKKYDVSVGEDTNILSYDDAQSISTYAIPAIQWACGAGVVTGKSGSKLDPKGNATRAEVAAMLMRFCENVK
jgi:hypothetical protein